MSDQPSSSGATILFDGQLALDFIDLINELQRVFRNISLDFEQTALAQDSHVVFMSEAMILRVGYGPEASWDKVMRGAARPEYPKVSTAMVDALAAEVRTAVEVSVEPGPTRTMPERTRLAACYHVVRHMLRRYDASLVYWDLSNTIFTAEEFESPTAMGNAPQPRRPGEVKRKTERPFAHAAFDMPQAETAPPGHFADGAMEVEQTHLRLDQDFANAVNLALAEHDARTEQRARAREDAATVRKDERLRRSRREIFADDLIEAVDSKRPPPREEIGFVEQMAVYVMTVTLMVLSFPVGFAMLIYTVFRGENLKATARAMALTGTTLGLSGMQLTQVLGVI